MWDLESLNVQTPDPQLKLAVSTRSLSRWSRSSNTLSPADDLSFDAGRWKSNEPSVRLKMSASLIASGRMIGLRKPDARGILGAPDSESKKRVVSYDLGLRIDVTTLDFTLDENGRVLEAEIHDH